MSRRRLQVAVLLAAAAAAAGCANGDAKLINGRLTSMQMIRKRPPDATYVVDPPDTIRVEALDDPSLGREVRVRQDGVVTLALLDDVHVGGLTTEQIRRKLEDLYSTYYKEPQFLVTVTGYNSKHISVYGEVASQGRQPYTGYQTVADVISQAGGVTRRAAPTWTKVIRGDPDAPEIYKVNLKKLLLKGETRENVSLAENDVVYVPPHLLAWLGYQIDSVLWPFRGALSAAASVEQLTD